jgi:hypothetical protein
MWRGSDYTNDDLILDSSAHSFQRDEFLKRTVASIRKAQRSCIDIWRNYSRKEGSGIPVEMHQTGKYRLLDRELHLDIVPLKAKREMQRSGNWKYPIVRKIFCENPLILF